MKCEDRFITSRSRNHKIVDCSLSAGGTWRDGEFVTRLFLSHSWVQGKGSQEISITMTPEEAIQVGKDLLLQAASRLADEAKIIRQKMKEAEREAAK